jgi:ABC-type Fe3+ transport system permease subunit
LLAAWMVVFAVTLRELEHGDPALRARHETLRSRSTAFIDNGTFEIAAALSVVLILMSIAACWRSAGSPARRTWSSKAR